VKHDEVRSEQLTLPLATGETPAHTLPLSVKPMLASVGEAPFDADAYFFEPWWPGARAFAFLERDHLRMQADQLSDPLAVFPELSVMREQLDTDGVVLDGTLLVLDEEGRPDRELLRRRLAEPDFRRGSGAFVASDLLWSSGKSLLAESFEKRHRRLSAVLRDGDRCVVSRGLRGEGITLAAAVASMGLDAISARRLAAPWRPGDAGMDWLRLPVTETPAAATRPWLVLLQRLPLDD
jgi:bifunctional non-homologous end joining protein LigD